MKPKNRISLLRAESVGASLVTVISVCFAGSALAVNNDWTGLIDTNWNEAGNWSLLRVPIRPNGQPAPNDFDDARVNILTNFPVIVADLAAQPRDILVGDGVGTVGRIDHTSGIASTGDGAWLKIGQGTGNGTYNLADTAATGGTLTGFGTSSGILNVGGLTGTGGRLYVGDGGTGLMNINTSGTVTVRNDMNIGVGNAGSGVLNMDGGTMTTGGWNFIGNGNGSTGTFNQSGGTFTNTGRTYVGGRDAGGTNSGVGNYNISGGLNSNAQNFSVGSGNLTAPSESTLTVSGTGTLEAGGTSIGGAAVGVNPGKGSATISGSGILTVNGEFWVGQGAGSVGSLTMSGGALNVNNWIAVGRDNGTGTVNMTGGTLTKTGAGNMIVGASGPGTMTQSGGIVNVLNGVTWVAETNNATGSLAISGTAEFNAGSLIVAVNQGTTGSVSVSGGTLHMGGNNEVQIGARGVGSFTQTAGVVNSSGWTVVGRYNNSGATGTLNVSGGVFNQTSLDRNMIIGEETLGTLNITSTGVVNSAANAGISIGNGTTGNGTINLDGGTLTTKSIHEGVSGTSAFNFDGGQLIAGPGASAVFMNNIDTVTVEDGGALIDTSANNISVNTALITDGSNGGLTKTGSGALFLNGVNTYTGTTSVSQGTLGGTGVIPGAVILAAGTSLSPGVTSGLLTVGSATLSGGTLAIDIVDAEPFPGDRLDVNGALNIANSALTITGTPSSQRYVLAQYGSLVGNPFNSVPALPPGYTLNYAYQGNKIVIERLALTTFDNYINAIFPGGQDNPALVGPNADPDGDGSRNSIEFALGGNPASGSDNPKVYVLIADSSDAGTEPELLMTIAVRNGTPAFTGSPSPTATQDGVTYTVQGSLDLQNFTSPVTAVNPVTTGLPAAPAGYTYRTFSLDGSNGTPGKGFMRVSVAM